MRLVRSTVLVLTTAAALSAASAPAHAGTGVDLTFSTQGSETGLPLPSATIEPRLGDPTTVVGTLKGVLENATVEPGTCELSLTPSPDGTSGDGRLANCATTALNVAFQYRVDPVTRSVRAYAVQAGTGGSPTAVTWHIDCWLSYPPLSIGCKLTIDSAA